MANRKRLFRDKPTQGDFGVYTFSDNNDSNEYIDSNSVPIRYDKFSGKDLYTTSVGDPINEAIMDSNIQNYMQPHSSQGMGGVDDLKSMGETSIRINSLVIKNRGVRTRINDVYFHFYLFSSEFFNPIDDNGNWKGYGTIRDGMHGGGNYNAPGGSAWFYSQNGPNYDENGEPGDFPGVSGLKIVRSFDNLNYGAFTGDGSLASVALQANQAWPYYSGTFQPRYSLLKKDGNGAARYENDVTAIFQQDGEYNPYYFGIHMDGDMNPNNGPDRSRNQTLSLFQFDPLELFDVTPSGEVIGKITTLNWDNHTYQTHSTGKKAPAWTAKSLQMTIDTTGGVTLASELNPDDSSPSGGNYYPPAEYLDIIEDVIPPIDSVIGDNNKFKDMDRIILNMFPTRQIMDKIYTDDNDLIAENQEMPREADSAYYMSKFADYIPYAITEASERDCQNFYENQEDRSYASAPNTIKLSFEIGRHPEPYDEYCERRGCYSLYDYTYSELTNIWFFNDSISMDSIKRDNPPENNIYTFIDYGYQDEGSQGEPSTSTVDIPTYNSVFDSHYIFFVVSWDDVDNQYESMENVLNDWPRDTVDLLKRQEENLYIASHIDVPLFNHYSTPGIKTIKSIVFNYSSKFATSEYDPANKRNLNIEPLRWKLVTTKIYLDIPISQFPDFGELGGDDYATIPWPYTTPVIGGVSENSKYSLSVNNTLAGGKLSDGDIIDETFLVNAQENNEIGQNIEKLDLEQIRFFNKAHDMNAILKIPTSTGMVTDTSVETLQDLDFPQWLNEFDTTSDDEITDIDEIVWEENGRPDISYWINTNILYESYQQGDELFYDNYIPIAIRDTIYWPIYNMHKDKLFKKSTDSIGNLVNSDFDFCQNFDLNENPQYIQFCEPIWPPQLVTTEGADEYNPDNFVDYENLFTDGCDLPPNRVYVTSDKKLLYNFGDNTMASLHLTLSPSNGWPNYFIGASGGMIEQAGWEVDVNPTGTSQNQTIRLHSTFDIMQTPWYFGDRIGIGGLDNQSCGTLANLDLFITTGDFLQETRTDSFVGDQFDLQDPEDVNNIVADWNQDGQIDIQDLFGTPWDGFPIVNYWDFSQDEIGRMPNPNDPHGQTTITYTGIVNITQIELFGAFGHNPAGNETYLEDVTIGGYNFGELDYAGGNIYQTVFQGNQPVQMNGGIINYSFTPGPHLDGSVLTNGYAWSMRVTFNRYSGEYPNGNGPWVESIYSMIDVHGSESHWGSNQIDIPYYAHQVAVGCTSPNAINYNPDAVEDDGSCIFADISEIESFFNIIETGVEYLPHPYYDISGSSTQISGSGYWSGDDWNSNTLTRTFSTGSFIEQIFINDNSDLDVISDCKFELNTGDLIGKAINDSSGKLNKGLLIGDFKVKKVAKNQPMRRDDFIKVAKKNNNDDGAL